MKETRRDTLKILGAIGTTCAFPFSANELYGQHVHGQVTGQAPGPAIGVALAPAGPYQPAFFGPAEWERVGKLADLIIPPTDTPGAVAAGVPQYIDQVLTMNPENRGLMRAGLEWVEERARGLFSESFVKLAEERQIQILQPLSDQAERHPRPAQPHEQAAEDLPVRFFRTLKNLTADGYYTSHAGLVEELGYKGNAMLAQFPACTVKL
ncbi:MAG TPA: gluconate 2-dehydrogenase subunit 3 family protein [Candidatus Acidoferrales bacterium]|nr:gluconate 2-dehydrogenase subunit 3 family protein [Candidatus Acidoferrales bacterium]